MHSCSIDYYASLNKEQRKFQDKIERLTKRYFQDGPTKFFSETAIGEDLIMIAHVYRIVTGFTLTENVRKMFTK